MQGCESNDIGCSQVTLEKDDMVFSDTSECVHMSCFVQCSWKLRELFNAGHLQRNKKKQQSFVTHHRSIMDVHVGEINFTPRVLIAHDIVRRCAICVLHVMISMKNHQDNMSLNVLDVNENNGGDHGAIALAGGAAQPSKIPTMQRSTERTKSPISFHGVSCDVMSTHRSFLHGCPRPAERFASRWK